YALESSLLENLQLVVLAAAFVFCVKTKEHKQLFIWIAMVLVILFLREINIFRVFFPIEGEVNTFAEWDELRYGYLAHPLYGLFIAYTLFYFFQKKLWKIAKEYLLRVKIPTIPYILMFVGMIVGRVGEKVYKNELVEESFELLFYLSLCAIIYLYGFDKKYKTKSEL
ncbi:MAG: hypothetical protein LBS73_06405, partial [Campylobacteraceae bacterium]|nr:hypothetical protein [Campylobacteraceae bacterium]